MQTALPVKEAGDKALLPSLVKPETVNVYSVAGDRPVALIVTEGVAAVGSVLNDSLPAGDAETLPTTKSPV